MTGGGGGDLKENGHLDDLPLRLFQFFMVIGIPEKSGQSWDIKKWKFTKNGITFFSRLPKKLKLAEL